VLYSHVPSIIGQKGAATFLDIDRFWGCEISFPPELDEYFQVRYIKRGAEPLPALRDMIRQRIWQSVRSLREIIQEEMEKSEEYQNKEEEAFRDAEEVMAEANKTSPQGKRGMDVEEQRADEELDKLVEQEVVQTGKSREERKKELVEKPNAIVPVRYPSSVFFDTVHQLGKIIIKLNVEHPFYKEVFEPLCGTIDTLDENSDINVGAGQISLADGEEFFRSKKHFQK
jgi:hypothetical protein